jgi:hypothetical protein
MRDNGNLHVSDIGRKSFDVYTERARIETPCDNTMAEGVILIDAFNRSVGSG